MGSRRVLGESLGGLGGLLGRSLGVLRDPRGEAEVVLAYFWGALGGGQGARLTSFMRAWAVLGGHWQTLTSKCFRLYVDALGLFERSLGDPWSACGFLGGAYSRILGSQEGP